MHQQRGPQLPWKDRLLGRAQTHLGHHRQNSRNTNTTQNTGSQHTDGHMDATKKRWVGGWNGGEQKNERSASGKVREYKKYATQHWILIYLKLKKIVSKGCIMLHSVSTEWIRQVVTSYFYSVTGGGNFRDRWGKFSLCQTNSALT